MTTGGDSLDADALAARLAEIDDLHARGVLDDDERNIARRAALDRAMSTSSPSSTPPDDQLSPKAPPEKGGASPGARRVRVPVVVGAVLAAVVAVAIVVAVVISGGSDSPAPVAATAEGMPEAPRPVSDALAPYTGGTFSINYPRGWIRETTDEDMGGYYDTTWMGRQGKDAILRVNTSPGDPADGYESALMLERGTQSTPGYRRVSLTRTTLGGMPAARWEFLTTGESGRTLRTVNVLASDGVDGWAVLTRNPVAQDTKWAPIFREVRQSFEVL